MLLAHDVTASKRQSQESKSSVLWLKPVVSTRTPHCSIVSVVVGLSSFPGGVILWRTRYYAPFFYLVHVFLHRFYTTTTALFSLSSLKPAYLSWSICPAKPPPVSELYIISPLYDSILLTSQATTWEIKSFPPKTWSRREVHVPPIMAR